MSLFFLLQKHRLYRQIFPPGLYKHGPESNGWTHGDLKVNINIKYVEDYRATVKFLVDSNVKSEEAFRVVMITDINYLTQATNALGFKVRRITDVLTRKDKTSSPLFFVNLELQTENKEIHAAKAVKTVCPHANPNKAVQCKHIVGERLLALCMVKDISRLILRGLRLGFQNPCTSCGTIEGRSFV